MLRRVLGETIELETVVSGGLWNTLADPNHLQNVIVNLAINARDAMDGAGRLTIEAGNAMLDDDYTRHHHDLASGQYVMVAVSDTGCGMTPETLARLRAVLYDQGRRPRHRPGLEHGVRFHEADRWSYQAL